jgi:hypothetical protein
MSDNPVRDTLGNLLPGGVAAVPPSLRDSVTVFVRKGADEDSRRISFRRPANVSAFDLINLGFAIDGNSALADIGRDVWDPDTESYVRYSYPTCVLGPRGETEFGEASTLSEALRLCQRGLGAFLHSHGFSVDFA